MEDLGKVPYLVPAGAAHEAFLFDVFATTWADEIAALPNPRLAAHVLRIQHTAQERRFDSRFPGLARFVVVWDGERAGRLYLSRTGTTVHVVDMTLLPAFRSRGIGTDLVQDLLDRAGEQGRTVTLRVPRRNARAGGLCRRLGFGLAAIDDLDNHFEWSRPAEAARAVACGSGSVWS